MNRFVKRRSVWEGVRRWLLPLAALLCLLLLFWAGVGSVSRTAELEALQSTEQAIRRAAVHCYAVEGAYPANLNYLEEHYGLLIDHDRYVVHYNRFASNLMPQIAVFRLGAGA